MTLDEISVELAATNQNLIVEPVRVSPEEELATEDRRDRDSSLPREVGVLDSKGGYLNKIWNWIKGAAGYENESILPYPLHSTTYLNQYAYERAFDPSDSGDLNIAGDIVIPPTWSNGSDVTWNIWPNGESISYSFGTNDECVKSVVHEAMLRYQEATNNCIRFNEVEVGSSDALEISTSGDECYSSLGFASEKNILNLGIGCINVGTVMHLLVHVLGLAHEDQRMDARTYVKVKPENIDVYGMSSSSAVNPVNASKFPFVFEPLRANGTKWGQIIASQPYEYGSLMHNSRAHYAVNIEESSTLVGTNGPKYEDLFGQRGFLTDRDARIINEMYSCQRLPVRVMDRLFKKPISQGLTYDALTKCLLADKAKVIALNTPVGTSV